MVRQISRAAGLLIASGVSSAAISEMMGIHPSLVSHWLRGVQPPPSELFAVITQLGGPATAAMVASVLAEHD